MDEDYIYPKSGVILEFVKLPKTSGSSLSVGLAKEPNAYCANGYDKPITHVGYDVYIFASFFKRQITVGYKHVNKYNNEMGAK